MSGTSQAAPHIAGMAALVLQALYLHKPDAIKRTASVVRLVKDILAKGCVPLDGISVEKQGAGMPVWSKIESELNAIETLST